MFPNRRKSKLSGVECRSELDTSWQRSRNCRYDSESYQFRPRLQQSYWFQHLQFVVVVVVVLNLFQLVAGSPVFMNNPSLAHFQTGRNIRHLPCVVRKSGLSGVCMFAIDCIKANGTHLGTCIDRFYFGSCCQTHDASVLLDQEISENSIEQNTISHYKHEPTTLPASDLFKITVPTTSAKTTSPKTTSTTTAATPSTSSSVQEQITTSIYNITTAIKDANSTIIPIYLKPRPTIIGTSTEIIINGISTASSTSAISSSASSVQTTTNSPTTTLLPSPKTTTSTSAITTTPEMRTESDIVTTTLSIITTTNLPKTETIQTTTIPTKVTTFQIVHDEFTTIVPSTSPPRIATPPTVLPTFLPPPRRPTRRPTLPTTTTKKPSKKTTPKVRPTLPPVNSIHTEATKKPIRTTTYRPSATTTRKTTNKRPGTKRPSSTNKKPTKRPGTTNPTTSPPKRPTNKPTTKKPITTTKKPTTTTRKPVTTTPKPTISTTTATSTTTQAPIATKKPTKAPRPKPKPTAEIVKVPVTLATEIVQKDDVGNTTETADMPQTTLNPKPSTETETVISITTMPSVNSSEQSVETTTSSFDLPTLTSTRVDSTTLQPEPSSLVTVTIKPSTSTPIPSTTSAPLSSTTEPDATFPSVTTTLTTTTSTTPVPPPKSPTTSPLPPEITTDPPTSTVAEPITLTTTTSTTPTPTTTTPGPLESTTLRPGLVTWTNMDDMPTNLSVFNGTNDEIWSPVPPPDWIPLATISPTAVSTDSDSSKPPIYADEIITDGPEVMYSSTTTSTTSPSVASFVPSMSSEEAPTTMADLGSLGAQTPGDLLENVTSPAMPILIDSTTEGVPDSSTSSEQIVLNSTIGSTNVSSSTYPPVSFEGIDYKQICGKRMFPEPRIVGGSNAAFGRWPWQISLRQWRTSTYLHKCGAALLNENWAITAAHCVDNVPPSDLLLRLGEYDLAEEEEPYGYQERRVQIVASHPQFDPRTFEYDLALLRFYEPVAFQPNIIPVCVPGDDTDFIGQTAYVTGWGRLYEDGPLPSVLQEVSVPVINNTICETMYRSAGYIEHIPHIFICAGWKKGGYDSCEGDSGGPMVLQRDDKRFLLGGVISWGIGCAEPNQPGVYTRISEFRDWINQILQF